MSHLIKIALLIGAIPLYIVILSMMAYFGKVIAIRILFKNKESEIIHGKKNN